MTWTSPRCAQPSQPEPTRSTSIILASVQTPSAAPSKQSSPSSRAPHRVVPLQPAPRRFASYPATRDFQRSNSSRTGFAILTIRSPVQPPWPSSWRVHKHPYHSLSLLSLHLRKRRVVTQPGPSAFSALPPPPRYCHCSTTKISTY